MVGELHVNWGTHRMKPTISKPIVQPSSKTASSNPKSPPKLNNIDVNTFKELSVISCFTSGPSKSDNNVKLVNNHHSYVRGLINSHPPLYTVPKSENETSDVVKATINSEIPLKIVPQQVEVVSTDLHQSTNHQSINDHSQSKIVRSDLSKAVDELILTEGHHTPCMIQETLISDTPLNVNVVSQCEIAHPDLPEVDNCLKPINDHNSYPVVQETMKPEASSNVIPKSKSEVLSSKEGLNSNNCTPLPTEDKKINISSKENNFLTEEIKKQTDQTESCNKNLAYTIEFEPDNRFLVYQHHKVGLEKSPLIFKKRVSKSYESIKQFSDKKSEFEDVEIQSNFTSESREPLKNKNVLDINEDGASASNLMPKQEVNININNTTQKDDVAISNPSNKASLSWRERVLEIMEDYENSSNKDLSIPIPKTSNQLDSAPASESKSVEAQSEVVKSDNNDKYTDIDKSLLIDPALVDILSPKNKTIENIANALLHNVDTIHEINLPKPVQLDSEETASIEEKSNKNMQSVEMTTMQNEFLDADLYFNEENNYEIENMKNDNSLDVDAYFVEEHNVADKILSEETSNIENIVKYKHSAEKLNSISDFESKNVSHILETDNCVNSIEAYLDSKGFKEDSTHPNDGYQTNNILEEANINRINVDNLYSKEMALDVPFVYECDFNDLVDFDDDVNQYRSKDFIEYSNIPENIISPASTVVGPKIEKNIEYRSRSDSELQRKQVEENETSEIVKTDLGTTFDNKDALSFGKSESGDSPILVKDKILRLAGQEFVLMANRNKKCDTSERFQKIHNNDTKSEIKNMRSPIYQDNNLYHGSYNPNTYCLNTHTNSYKDSVDIYSIFSHLKKNNEEGPKITTWQTMPPECSMDCESVSEKDSLNTKLVEDSSDEFYIFQHNHPYNNRAPFDTESIDHPYENISVEKGGYSFSSSSSSYNNGEDEHSLNDISLINQESLSDDSPLPFISSKEQSCNGCTSSRIPLLKSKRNDVYKSNTLPPLFAEPKMSAKCSKNTNTKKSDFSKFSTNLKNDYYTHFSSIENSSEESDSDWDLSDYDTYEKKKTVFTRSSKTVYNKYYEQVEYSQESNEFQTIKTSVSNLPLPHADFFQEKEFKLPKIQTRHVPINQKVQRKKTMGFEKLPLLRNREDWKWFV